VKRLLGGKETRASPKPDAVLKYAHHPIAMLGGLWESERVKWANDPEQDARPPVYILVCKDTAIAKVMHAWLTLTWQKTSFGTPVTHSIYCLLADESRLVSRMGFEPMLSP
jgi:hypothetical protein